jgi:hypothetical protein
VTFNIPQKSDPGLNIPVKFDNPIQIGGVSRSHFVKLRKIAASIGPPVNKIKPIIHGSRYKYGTIDPLLELISLLTPLLEYLRGTLRVPLK